MKLTVECMHGYKVIDHDTPIGTCGPTHYTDPADILAALADAGVLDDDHDFIGERFRYVSPWKETK